MSRATRGADLSQDRYEVLVVDNGSSEPVDWIVRRFHRATLVSEPRRGQFTARNTGVARSKGTILAFTDADCLPLLDWLEKGVQALLGTPSCAQVGGSVDVFPRHRRRRTAVKCYELIQAFPQKQYLELGRYAVTANMFTFRDVYEMVGPFDEQMFSGGDDEWGRRSMIAGSSRCIARTRGSCIRRDGFTDLYEKIRRTSAGHRYLNALGGGRPYWPGRLPVTSVCPSSRSFVLLSTRGCTGSRRSLSTAALRSSSGLPERGRDSDWSWILGGTAAPGLTWVPQTLRAEPAGIALRRVARERWKRAGVLRERPVVSSDQDAVRAGRSGRRWRRRGPRAGDGGVTTCLVRTLLRHGRAPGESVVARAPLRCERAATSGRRRPWPGPSRVHDGAGGRARRARRPTRVRARVPSRHVGPSRASHRSVP